MPDFLHPPYAPGAIFEPRTLLRWLDVNAQNGPLGRVESYITLPAFTFNDVTWNGYSDIVAAYNFEGPNNFSLKYILGSLKRGLLTDVPSMPNYMLCIMWIDATTTPYTVHRYALWNNVGEVMYIPYPLYSEQMIGQNFRLEIWSTNNSNGTVSQATPINLYTSVRGAIDYRYGVDFVLVNPDAVVTNFSVSTQFQFPTDVGLISHYIPSSIQFIYEGITPVTSWTDIVSGHSLNPNTFGSNIQADLTGLPVNSYSVQIQNNTGYLQANQGNPLGVMSMMMVCQVYNNVPAISFLLSAYPTGISLFWNNGTITAGGNNTPNVTGLSYATWYTMFIFLNGGQMTVSVYDSTTGTLIGTNTTLAPAVTYTNTLAVGNAGMQIIEIAVMSNTLSAADITAINNYVTGSYFSTNPWTLPFTWPAGATPQLNYNKNNWLPGALSAQANPQIEWWT